MPAAAVAMQQVSKRAIDHRSYHLQSKGPSTLVRIRVRFAIRFHARFARKPGRDPIFHLTLITYNGRSTPISKKNKKITCGIPLAANRTPNRTPIRTRNRTCRRPLMQLTRSLARSVVRIHSVSPFVRRASLPLWRIELSAIDIFFVAVEAGVRRTSNHFSCFSA
jgi:hypothetical protein